MVWLLAALTLGLLLTSCGPSAAPAPPQAPAEPAQPEWSATLPLPTATESATPLPATDTPIPPTPTETPLPTLDLPTVLPRLPERILWTGLPTYPGDSQPGHLFRIEYDPELWAQTEDNFDEIVLAHRDLPGCILSTYAGRGLPMTLRVETEFTQEGDLFIEVNRIFSEEKLEFMTFFISDSRVRTAFRLESGENPDACLQDAQEILSSMRSLFARPTATPTP